MTVQDKRLIKQNNIIKHTYELLLEKGLENFSLNYLLEELKMSKSSFYNYFKSKDQLFATLLDNIYMQIDKEYICNLPENDFQEKMKKLFAIYLLNDKVAKNYVLIINELWPMFIKKENPHLYAWMNHTYDYFFLSLEYILKTEVTETNLNKSVLSQSKMIIATIDGLVVHKIMFEKDLLEENILNYFDFIFEIYKVEK